MEKSETFISYEDVKRSFVDKITVSGGRLLGGSRVSLKAVCIYLNGVLSKIAALPRVELVRCKDCKHWDTSWRPNDPTTHFCEIMGEFQEADFYCADGIRRQTDEADNSK